jgi:hypothetical protein
VDADLVRLHDGLLDDDAAQRIREHLAQCPRCRELDDAISFSRSALETLSPIEAHEREREQARAAMLAELHSGGKPPHSNALRAVAAALILVAGMAWWWYRPRVRFVPAPPQRRSIETMEASSPQSTTSIADARRLVEHLKPETIFRRLIGRSGSTLFYEIDSQPVTLVVARADALPDPPPSLVASKRLELRHDREARIFTWSASGDAYSLRVPAGVPVAHACAICHEGTRMMPLIERATRGM